MNLTSLLTDHPFSDDELLLHTVDRSVTAGDVRRAVAGWAKALRESGLHPGQAVAAQLPNGPEAVIAMLGTWMADCVWVPVNPRSPSHEVDRVVDVTRPAALLDESGLAPRARGRTYEPGIAFVLWTSGTTGEPKAVLHTHEAYLELIDRVLGPLRPGPGDRSHRPTPNLIPVSLALNAGIYNALFGLRAGAALVIIDRFEARGFADLVRRFQIRSTVLPPAAITMLNDDPHITDLSPLKYVRSITAPLSPLQARRFTEQFHAFVLNGYGQAEIGEVIGWTAADAKGFPEKIGAVGRPHPGVKIKVVGDESRVLEPGGTGRLHVRPPNRALGYAGGGDLDDRVDADGYLDTGDIARVDGDGFVWIEGRASDVINRGGNKVFPGDVEEVLRLSPAVADVAVVGAPDDRLGEVPVAFFTGEQARAGELEALCRDHLAPYKVPVAFKHVGLLPRNEAGKLLRSELVSRAIVEPS
ncbi:MAG TPA: long-chain fatty acid--CoA ligase [Acidimicrobiales bacterium]|jgi:acyl-CoA synthetase (AMP-forming)/AMP-acid ligase II